MGLKIGLSGAGYIAPVHIEAWRRAGANVVAIADPDLARAHFTADHHQIGKIYSDAGAMIDAGGIDVLDVAAPRQVHIEQSLAGLAAGLPVICQKPLAPSLAEAEAFAQKLGQDDRFMVHENWRFRQPYRQIRQWIDQGLVGDIRHVSMAMRSTAMLPDETGLRPAAGRQPFMLKEPRLVLAEVLIHNIDTLRFLVGDLSLIAARAARVDPEITGETSATLYAETADATPVMINGDMTAHGTPNGASDWLEILGSKGRVTLENTFLRLHGPQPQEIHFGAGNLLAEAAAATIAHFVEQLECGGAFETGLEDNLKTLRLVEQAYDLSAPISEIDRP